MGITLRWLTSCWGNNNSSNEVLYATEAGQIFGFVDYNTCDRKLCSGSGVISSRVTLLKTSWACNTSGSRQLGYTIGIIHEVPSEEFYCVCTVLSFAAVLGLVTPICRTFLGLEPNINIKIWRSLKIVLTESFIIFSPNCWNIDIKCKYSSFSGPVTKGTIEKWSPEP